MNESSLMESAKKWVVDNYAYNSNHLINSLFWLDKLAPGSREALRLATVTHDMERAFPGPDQPIPTKLVDEAYHAAHSARSARIVGEWLRSQSADDQLTRDVEDLVRVHEDGGWPEANLLQAADSLSFLDVNVDMFMDFVRKGKWPVEEVRIKLDYSYDRIQVPQAKEWALPMLQSAQTRLAAVSDELSPR